MANTNKSPQGGTFQNKLPEGISGIEVCCLGRILCGGCTGHWEEVTDFAVCSLNEKERRLRYFSPVATDDEVRRREHETRHSYWRIIVARDRAGNIAAACWLGRDLARIRGLGKMPDAAKTERVELAFVVAPEHRGKGLAELLTRAAIQYCSDHYAGCEVEIQADEGNKPMLKTMGKFGIVKRNLDEPGVRCTIIHIRDRNPHEMALDTALGIWGFFVTLACVTPVAYRAHLVRIERAMRRAAAA